jgi:hypothetical protein
MRVEKKTKNSNLRGLEFIPRKLDKNADQEFHLWDLKIQGIDDA